MKLTKTINVQGTIVPAGTELHFSNEGVGYYEGVEVKKDLIPEVAVERQAAKRVQVTGGQLGELDPKRPAFVIVHMKMFDDRQRIVSVHATNNAKLLYQVRDMPETESRGGFDRVFAASINELEDGGALDRFDAVFNGDEEGFDEMIQDVIKKAKPAKKTNFLLWHTSHEDGGDWRVIYDEKDKPKYGKTYTPICVQ
jgi:hypothetical protein